MKIDVVNPEQIGARPRRVSLPALSGLRFFLAAHVLFFHFAPFFFGKSSFARNFTRMGSSAIAGFFLLSGFILTYSQVFDCGRIDQSKQRFWLSRFLRIYPAYFLAFLLSAPFALAQLRHSPHTIYPIVETGLFLMLLQTWVPGLWSYWNYPAWSLSVEAFFYAIFPGLVPWIFRRCNWWITLSIVWICGLIVPVLLIGTNRFEWLLKLPPLHLPEFAFGMILGDRFVSHPGNRWQLSDGDDHADVWMAPLAGATLIACYGSGWFSASLVDHGLFAPLMGCVLWGLARGKGCVAQILGSKPIVYLGEVSYGIYIYQFPVFTGCFVLTKRLGLQWNTRLTFLSCCMILVCVSVMAFELVEKPLRSAGMKHFDRLSRRDERI